MGVAPYLGLKLGGWADIRAISIVYYRLALKVVQKVCDIMG